MDPDMHSLSNCCFACLPFCLVFSVLTVLDTCFLHLSVFLCHMLSPSFPLCHILLCICLTVVAPCLFSLSLTGIWSLSSCLSVIYYFPSSIFVPCFFYLSLSLFVYISLSYDLLVSVCCLSLCFVPFIPLPIFHSSFYLSLSSSASFCLSSYSPSSFLYLHVCWHKCQSTHTLSLCLSLSAFSFILSTRHTTLGTLVYVTDLATEWKYAITASHWGRCGYSYNSLVDQSQGRLLSAWQEQRRFYTTGTCT